MPFQEADKDAKLVALYLEGDDAALKALFDRHFRSVYVFVHRYAGSPHDTQDIVQETFFKVWKNLKRFDMEKNFKTWIFTIAKNTALDWMKKKKAISFSAFDDLIDSPDGNSAFLNVKDDLPLQDELFAEGEVRKNIDEAIKTLNPDQRAVVLLRYESDLTFEEIGRVVGKPTDTVKSHYRRALSILRRYLAHIAPNGLI